MFGVANVAPVLAVPADLDVIVRTAVDVALEAEFETFAVRARRARTHFPHASQIVNERVGDAVRVGLSKRVDLSHPDLTIRIEIVGDRAYVSARRVEGPGGLPVGTSGQVVALLSAGIDSPVALWRMMKRGSSPTAVHFHGQPFTDPSSERKVARILEALRPWGYRRPWWSVPLGEAQREVTVSAPPALRTLLYRRLMLRISAHIAEEEGALAVVTGESLGQVASQTLENMVAVDAAAPITVLRPLVGTDKIEIMRDAERIGTYLRVRRSRTRTAAPSSSPGSRPRAPTPPNWPGPSRPTTSPRSSRTPSLAPSDGSAETCRTSEALRRRSAVRPSERDER